MPQRTSAYVEQGDVHIGELTVRDPAHSPVCPQFLMICLSCRLPTLSMVLLHCLELWAISEAPYPYQTCTALQQRRRQVRLLLIA